MAKRTPPPRPFFGCRHDIESLLARVTQPGMTAVLGRPQIGKTRLGALGNTEAVMQIDEEIAHAQSD